MPAIPGAQAWERGDRGDLAPEVRARHTAGTHARRDLPDDLGAAVDHSRVDLHRGGAGAEARQRVLGGEDPAARVDHEGRRGPVDLADDANGAVEQRLPGEPTAPFPHPRLLAGD